MSGPFSASLDAMKLHILAVGHKMPDWICTGFDEYAKRMPPELRIELREIKPEARTGGRQAEQRAAEIPMDGVHDPVHPAPPRVPPKFLEENGAGVDSRHRAVAELGQRQGLRSGPAAEIDGHRVISHWHAQPQPAQQVGLGSRRSVDIIAQHPGVVLGEQAFVVIRGRGHGSSMSRRYPRSRYKIWTGVWM